MRFTVWYKRQVVCCLAALLIVNTLFTVWITSRWLQKPKTETKEAAAPVETLAPLEAVPVMAAEDFSVSIKPTPAPAAAPKTAVATPGKDFHMEVIRTSGKREAQGMRILIYHTHTWEAFAQVESARYEETEKWRTKDDTCNVVAVGKALSAALRALGFEVVHDTTAFEPPNLSTSYERSLKMLEERAARGESYDLYIDLHRDAFSSANAVKRTVKVGGEDVARFMVLVGKGVNYSPKPDWEDNLALAKHLTECMNHLADGVCREVKVKTGRFNQHVASHCVLIECGNNFNTLEEVLRGVPYLAEAIGETLTEARADEEET